MTLEKKYNELKKKSTKEIIEELDKEGKVITPLTDRVFKALFSDKDIIGILEYMILYITNLYEEDVIGNIDIVNPYETVHNINEKEMTHDLKLRVGNNTLTLEMNRFNGKETKFRNSAHYHESIVKSLERAKSYRDIGMVIQINFDASITQSNKLISKIMMMDVDNHVLDSSEEGFIKYKINLHKVLEIRYNEVKPSRFEKILLIMQESDKEKLKKISDGDKELKLMVKKIEKLSKNPDLVQYIKDEKLRKIAYEMDMKESKETGYSEGRESGYSEGRESGYKEGLEENKVKTAKKMLEKNMDIKDISDVTGFNEEDILKL